MKIVVTGGAGFIASHIVDAYIKAGHNVSVIDNFSTGKKENLNPKATLYEMDINDEKINDIFIKEKFDILNHHAAQLDLRFSVKSPIIDAKTNIIGSLNLYEAALSSGIKKIIFASSGGTVYGEQSYFPADEQHPTHPTSPYGIAKLINEHYLYYYKEVHQIDYVALRYANIYGPRQNSLGEAGVIAIFADKMLRNEQPVINGDGLNSRDYVFVSDVVEANIFALNENFSGIFNISTGIETNVNYLFNKLRSLINPGCKELHGEAKTGEQRRSVCSNKKINSFCGWFPKVKLEDGIEKTVEFFKTK
jgi:UDP-glucose 4-epimerase